MVSPDDDERLLKARLSAVTGDALVDAGAVLMVLGLTACVGSLSVSAVNGDAHYLIPGLIAGVGALWGLLVWAAARRRSMRLAAALVFLANGFPSLFFIVAEFTLTGGAAAYVVGPFTYLYAFPPAATGFLLRPRLSLAAGAFAALQLLLLWWCVRDEVRAALVPGLMYKDIVEDAVWVFRALVTAGVGLASAGIALVAQRLVSDVLEQQRETLSVSRLFGQYVSPEVKDKILAERANLKGERRTVAVLFSDVRGFTSWAEHTDPADVVVRLNLYFERMVDAIEQEGGVVDKFIGDAVMATFGGVVPVDNAAGAALGAARRMRLALHELNLAWQAEGLPRFDTGIGLAYGPVIEGPLGSERRREFTVVGDTVNTASRLESATKDLGCPVVMNDALVAQLPVASRNELVDLGTIHVKGKATELAVWGLRV